MTTSTHRLRSIALGAAAAALAFTGMTPAGAWGAQGHQYVGSLAWALLNANARAHVAALLGANVGLTHAAVWPDCVRSVNASADGTFTFTVDKYTSKACNVFADGGAEQARMTDYASRNWTNCEYSGQRTKCNLAYHFADVNVKIHNRYDEGYFGAGSGDVVQAIKAAITVLGCLEGQTCPTAGPFNIKDKREALFLLTHFMGDLHQPLHVGAVYLDGSNAAGDDHGRATTGGNALLLKSGRGGENLHHSWDEIAPGLGTTPSAAAIARGCRIAYGPASATGSPESWASESVIAASAAYKGLTYTPDSGQKNHWDVKVGNAQAYSKARTKTQADQLIKAGARLAMVLNTMWPSSTAAPACGGSLTPRPHG
ncbi:MAG TPA: S1/P1 nuclease [Allosphingosinicella sp.]|jgi:hypothetical protein